MCKTTLHSAGNGCLLRSCEHAAIHPPRAPLLLDQVAQSRVFFERYKYEPLALCTSIISYPSNQINNKKESRCLQNLLPLLLVYSSSFLLQLPNQGLGANVHFFTHCFFHCSLIVLCFPGGGMGWTGATVSIILVRSYVNMNLHAVRLAFPATPVLSVTHGTPSASQLVESKAPRISCI